MEGYTTYSISVRRETIVAIVVFFVSSVLFIATSVWGTTIGTDITTAHMKASSTVQATGNMFGYTNISRASTSPARRLSIEGDGIVTGSFKAGPIVGTSTLDIRGNVMTGGTTTTQGFAVEKADSIFSSGADATTTVGILAESSTKGGCIEMTAATNGTTYRIFVNAAGNGLTVEAGTCR